MENRRQPKTLKEALVMLEAAEKKISLQSNELQKQSDEIQKQTEKIQSQTAELQQKTNELQQKTDELQQKTAEIKKQSYEIQKQEDAYEKLAKELIRVKEELRLQLAYRFARHSEKYYADQPSLFDELGENIIPEEDGTKVQDEQIYEEEIVKSYKRKRKCGRKQLSESLPRKTLVLDIDEKDKHCACGHDLVKIGEDVSEQLIHIPEQIYVLQTVRPKYACRNCEGSGDEDKPAVRQMPAPKRIIEKSIASPSLLASVVSNKFELALPYYRQEKAYEHRLIGISRQDMSNWQEAIYKKCRPLEALIVEHIKSGNVLHLDETTVQVLEYEGGGKELVNGKPRSKSYMWLASGGPKERPAVVFRYNKTRSGLNALEFINGFSGYLMTDGYEGYETALSEHDKFFPKDKINHCSCLAHARRKFSDASKVSNSKSPEEAIKMIRKIYRVDRAIRETAKYDEEIISLRKEKLTPLFEDFHSWLKEKESHCIASNKFGEAVSYTLKRWEKFKEFMNCAEMTPDNNLAENSIRPFVLGRKNWLFSGSEEGARSSCFMYTLIENAKLNGLVPYEYLRCLFEQAAGYDENSDWSKLLPWNIELTPWKDLGQW